MHDACRFMLSTGAGVATTFKAEEAAQDGAKAHGTRCPLDSMMLLRREEDRDPEPARRSEISCGWRRGSLQPKGRMPALALSEEQEMRTDGFDGERIVLVSQTLQFYQSTGFGPGQARKS
jgi:hypothetical protein